MSRARNTYLVLHGFQNHRPPGHWQHWLAGALAERGHEVRYPQLPEPDAPRLADWLAALEEHGKRPTGIRAEGEFVVLAHSLGVLLWLRAVAAGRAPEADRVLLVAPPSPQVTASIPEIAEFADGLDLDGVRTRLTVPTRLVYGDGDPYCPEGADLPYGIPLGLDLDHVPDGGHLNPDHGYGAWPSILEWSENPAVRVRGNQ
ncbi:alpha/beta hydrolase [Streptomyces sp. SKN60]|uniref:RBBP9/YdeN family alpha/beta hydrolase n=1 Tax=Streptomyces sp. SKN60 TaxID=2855506 RepID=UPI00224518C4|nr:alpha/beta hydrolase [Streptomyces sp. SKN60]MCX2179026.1 alpha/beta hydrolase [Streptomyces sp. SKN60]